LIFENIEKALITVLVVNAFFVWGERKL